MASFHAELANQSTQTEEPPTSGVLTGQLTYWPGDDTKQRRLEFVDTRLTSDTATGVCNAQAAENLNAPADLPEPGKDDILPIDTLLSYNFDIRCALDTLTIGTETFADSQLDLTNENGHTHTTLGVASFLGGSLSGTADINANKAPVTWHVVPDLKNVDSQRLMDWTDQRLQWIAPIVLNSSVTLAGNTEDELAQSVRAQTDFDGGKGQLNIAKIKEQLLRLATLTRKREEVESWQDMWNYESFVGNWQINGPQHMLEFVLDNMQVQAEGEYDYAKETIDLRGEVIIGEALDSTPFKINPLLQDTPIPIRCRGPVDDPECKVDERASKNLIAKALQRNDESGLRRKIEEKIDEEVPEQYREAARNLLDLLGRTLEDDD